MAVGDRIAGTPQNPPRQGLRWLLLPCLIVVLIAAASVRHAGAAFPGHNGKIVFHSSRGLPGRGIFAIDGDGGGLRRLTDSKANDLDPAYSASGRRIVFARRVGGNYEIYKMRANGSHQRRLTHSAADDFAPVFSPAGKIAFVSHRGVNRIYRMNADGSHQRRLANGEAPAFSPSGRKIVFASDRSGSFKVYKMNAGGSHQRLLADGNAPSFSPGGRKIVFISDRNDNWNEVFRMSADGSHQRRLTFNVDDGTGVRSRPLTPSFSPSGKQIVFALAGSAFGEEFNAALYRMKADGSHQHRLTAGSIYDDRSPDWGIAP